MVFLTGIAFIIVILGLVIQSSKDSALTRERRMNAQTNGECNYYTAEQKNIHIPSGMECMKLSVFSPDHKSCIDEFIERGSGRLLGGQRFDRKSKRYIEMSADEVIELKEMGWK